SNAHRAPLSWPGNPGHPVDAASALESKRAMHLDGRHLCSARRHSRHLFGDMTDTFWAGQVDGCDLVGGEADGIEAVTGFWPDGEAFAPEGFGDFPESAFEADIVFGAGHGAHNLVLAIFDFGQDCGECPRAGAVSLGRHRHADRLMRPLAVIDLAPLIEGALHLRKAVEDVEGEDFLAQRAMEALILAAALWMVGSGVDEVHAQLEKPDPEPGPVPAGGIAPGRAVVHEHGIRQAVTLKGCLQMALNRGFLLVRASLQAGRVTGMVIDDGQGMAALAIAEFDPTLEVHLPEKIGGGLFEPLLRRCAVSRRNDAAVTGKNGMHSRYRRRFHALAFQASRNLARAPGRMGIANRKDDRFDLCRRPGGARMRTPRAIDQLRPMRTPTIEPFVARVRVYPEPPAKLAAVGAFQQRQAHKLSSLVHLRHLSPGHGRPPSSQFRATMRCRLCPRTP